MSTDRWSVCPKCKNTAFGKQDKQLDEARKKYGKIPSDEYEAAIIDNAPLILFDFMADKGLDWHFADETLREDYHFKMDNNGLFTAEYSARCDRCGFKFNFKHSEQIEI